MSEPWTETAPSTFREYCYGLADAAERLERIATEFPDLFEEYVQFRTGASVLHGMTLHAAAEHILKETGRPMTTAEITNCLQKRGFGIGEQHLRNSLFTAMGRHKATFCKPKPGLWSLAATHTETGE